MPTHNIRFHPLFKKIYSHLIQNSDSAKLILNFISKEEASKLTIVQFFQVKIPLFQKNNSEVVEIIFKCLINLFGKPFNEISETLAKKNLKINNPLDKMQINRFAGYLFASVLELYYETGINFSQI